MHLVIDTEQFTRIIKRMTHQIIEYNLQLEQIVLVGIEKKGTPLAKEIQSYIKEFEGVEIPLETIDISAHRDDDKKKKDSNLHFYTDITNKTIILVDDVLYTGRSVRAAMDAIMEMGRPAKIELAIFVDRGHRELPIRADFVGKNIPTSRTERVVCDFTCKIVSLV